MEALSSQSNAAYAWYEYPITTKHFKTFPITLHLSLTLSHLQAYLLLLIALPRHILRLGIHSAIELSHAALVSLLGRLKFFAELADDFDELLVRCVVLFFALDFGLVAFLKE